MGLLLPDSERNFLTTEGFDQRSDFTTKMVLYCSPLPKTIFLEK